jgi:hypothetical protein
MTKRHVLYDASPHKYDLYWNPPIGVTFTGNTNGQLFDEENQSQPF